jgi:hypothetical protein
MRSQSLLPVAVIVAVDCGFGWVGAGARVAVSAGGGTVGVGVGAVSAHAPSRRAVKMAIDSTAKVNLPLFICLLSGLMVRRLPRRRLSDVCSRRR